MRIVLCYPVGKKHIDQIQAAAPDFEVVNAGQERVDELLPTADIFIGHAKVPVNWDRVLQAGKLRWIQSSAAGLDHCLVPGVIESDEIVVSSASGLFAPQVAEQTFSLLFGVIRRAPLFFRADAILCGCPPMICVAKPSESSAWAETVAFWQAYWPLGTFASSPPISTPSIARQRFRSFGRPTNSIG